jgi:hypothetical protein
MRKIRVNKKYKEENVVQKIQKFIDNGKFIKCIKYAKYYLFKLDI